MAEVIRGTAGNDSLSNDQDAATILALGGDDTVKNSGENVSIDGGKGDDTINNSGDNTNIHGGAGDDTIDNASGNNILINSGSGDDSIINSGKIHWNDETQQWEATSSPDNATIDGDKGEDYIYNNGNSVTIAGGKGDDSIQNGVLGYAYGANVTIDGGAGDDSIINYGWKVTINGGAGDDYIENHSSKVLFTYADGDGNDVVTDYASGDKISLSADFNSLSLNGNDVVIVVGKEKLTVKNTNELTLIDSSGTELSTVISSVAFDNKSASKFTLASGIEDADASSRTKAIKIVGNALDNSILGSSKNDTLDGQDGNDYLVGNAGNDKFYGDNGDDTLWGGKGNDTLWGDDGADEFIYAKGDGKDVIIGFTSDDILTLDGISFTSATVNSKGTQVTLKLGSGSITFKDFAKDTEFNIGEETYQVVKSGKKYSFAEK